MKSGRHRQIKVMKDWNIATQQCRQHKKRKEFTLNNNAYQGCVHPDAASMTEGGGGGGGGGGG